MGVEASVMVAGTGLPALLLMGACSGPEMLESSSRAIEVEVAGALKVSGGQQHTCAIRPSGAVACWGRNHRGQLGNGELSENKYTTPVAVVGIDNAVAIAAGRFHSCAVLADGSARCWGQNASGQLGNGSNNRSTVPVAVSGLTDATSIATGSYFTCAIRSDGTARCWGQNIFGQLGNGQTGNSCGAEHACAVLASGAVRCWGRNNSGQLGNGGNTDRKVPVAVANLADAAQVDSGGTHSCAARRGAGAAWFAGAATSLASSAMAPAPTATSRWW